LKLLRCGEGVEESVRILKLAGSQAPLGTSSGVVAANAKGENREFAKPAGLNNGVDNFWNVRAEASVWGSKLSRDRLREFPVRLLEVGADDSYPRPIAQETEQGCTFLVSHAVTLSYLLV
jgi:hypothetical protein